MEKMMKQKTPGYLSLSFLFVFLLVMPNPAIAYIGPGAGLTAIGTVIALVAVVFFTIVGFIWYPMKRFLHYMKSKKGTSEEPE